MKNYIDTNSLHTLSFFPITSTAISANVHSADLSVLADAEISAGGCSQTKQNSVQKKKFPSKKSLLFFSEPKNSCAFLSSDLEAHDLLVGAKKIAAAFGLTRRQVYNLKEGGKAPIHCVPGLGIVSSRKKLGGYLKNGQH